MVEVSPAGQPAKAMRHPATTQAATNKLLRAAVFELRDSGRYELTVSVDGPNDHAQIRFALDVGNAWSPRTGVWPWILWPVPVIAFYGVHRRLVAGSAKVPCRRSRPQPGATPRGDAPARRSGRS
jgi:hypothetical protein